MLLGFRGKRRPGGGAGREKPRNCAGSITLLPPPPPLPHRLDFRLTAPFPPSLLLLLSLSQTLRLSLTRPSANGNAISLYETQRDGTATALRRARRAPRRTRGSTSSRRTGSAQPSCSSSSSSSVTIAWTAPATNGAPILRYDARRSGTVVIDAGTSLSQNFGSLGPATAYSFDVRACNSAGCSSYSTTRSAFPACPRRRRARPIRPRRSTFRGRPRQATVRRSTATTRSVAAATRSTWARRLPVATRALCRIQTMASRCAHATASAARPTRDRRRARRPTRRRTRRPCRRAAR